MKTKAIFITFDFGIKGDYEGLYKWLDEHEAQERGYGIAFIKAYQCKDQIKTDIGFVKEIRESISKLTTLGKSDRIYMIWNSFEASKMKAAFLFGKSKQAPWTGFAQNNEVLDFDL